MNPRLKYILLGLLLVASGVPAWGDEDPGSRCVTAIGVAEQSHGIPRGLLAAIAQVESGRRDPKSGAFTPWPWTINAEGRGYIFETSADAIATVKALQARGLRSIDVGCLQVNLMHHPTAFPTLDAALDPASNADYAAQFLNELFSQTGDWTKAAAAYHSFTPDLGAEYQQKVFAVWTKEPFQQSNPAPSMSWQLAAAWSATLPPHPFPSMAPIEAMTPLSRSRPPRIIALGGGASPGRSLDSYRANPILLAIRTPGAGG